jgi:hypothetical protein
MSFVLSVFQPAVCAPTLTHIHQASVDYVSFVKPALCLCRDIQVPQEAPAEVAQLINECLRPNPALRPTAAQLYDRIQVCKCSGCVVHDVQDDRVKTHAMRILTANTGVLVIWLPGPQHVLLRPAIDRFAAVTSAIKKQEALSASAVWRVWTAIFSILQDIDMPTTLRALLLQAIPRSPVPEVQQPAWGPLASEMLGQDNGQRGSPSAQGQGPRC